MDVAIINIVPSFQIRLRELCSADENRVFKWLADPYLVQLTFVAPGPGGLQMLPFTGEMARQYLDILIYDKSRKSFAIEVNNNHVGNIGLKQYNSVQKTSECFIEIGEGEYRGRGVGTAAMCMLLDYGFLSLELEEIRLEVLEFNYVAIRVYERIGFAPTGLTGWHYDCHKQYWRVLGMKIAAERWTAKRQQVKLSSGVSINSL